MVNEPCVVVKIRREADGLFVATSPELAGVCVVSADLEAIIEDLPAIVRLWYRSHHGIDIEPFFELAW